MSGHDYGDGLDWLDEMADDYYGGQPHEDGSSFDPQRYEELMRAHEDGNGGGGGQGNGRPDNGNGRQLTREDIERYLDIPEGGEPYRDAPDPHQFGVGRFLLGILRGQRSYEARSRVERHQYKTQEAADKFEKKFWVRPQEANGDVVKTDDGLTFVHEGFGDFSYVDHCPKCGQVTKARQTRHYTEFGKMIASFEPYHDHRCGATNKDEEEIEQFLDGLQPAPPPQKPPEPARRTPHVEWDDDDDDWPSSSSSQPTPAAQTQETEVDRQRRARQVQAQRQPGERAVGHRRSAPRQQQQGFPWGLIVILGGLLAVGLAIAFGANALKGKMAAAAAAAGVQQPTTIQQVEAAVQQPPMPTPAAVAPAGQQVAQPTNTPIPQELLQQLWNGGGSEASAAAQPTNTPLPSDFYQQQPQVAPAVQPTATPVPLHFDGLLAWADAFPQGMAWETMYQGVKIRIAIVGPNNATYAIFWSDGAHEATYGAAAGTLEQAMAIAGQKTVHEWGNLPTFLGWEE